MYSPEVVRIILIFSKQSENKFFLSVLISKEFSVSLDSTSYEQLKQQL